MAYGFTYTLPAITGSHSDFPVCMRTADFPGASIDGGASSILNGGGDLRAYTSSAKTTRLPVDVVSFVTGGTPSAEVHIKVPSAATGSTIYIEADDTETTQPAVTDTYGRDAVWSDYAAVYHGNDLSDSSGNENNLTAYGTAAADDGGGILGKCFTGLNGNAANYLRALTAASISDVPLTIQSWYKPTADTEALQTICGVQNAGTTSTDTLVRIGWASNLAGNPIRALVLNETTNSNVADTAAATVGEWNLTHAVVDASGGLSVFMNGGDKATNTSLSVSVATLTSIMVGASWLNIAASFAANGLIDEVRLRRSVVADDWVATEYSNQSATTAWGSIGTWSDGGSDVTAPTLSTPTGTTTGDTTADGTVDTDEANGTLYAVATTSGTAPSVAQIQAGQDNAGSAAAYDTSQAVSATGTQNVAATGLSPSTAYYWHYQHKDAAANDSTVVTSASFTTDAASDTTPDAYAFTDQTGVELSTLTLSDTITVAGIDASTPISITGGEYSINGGAFTSASGSVVVNDQVQLRQTSAGSYLTTTDVDLDIGGVLDTWSVETNALTSDTIRNNTGTILGSQAVSWTWLPSARLGSLTGVTPTEGTGTTDANGLLSLDVAVTTPGILLIAVLNTDATDDYVYYEAFPA